MLQFAEIHAFLQARLQEAAKKATLRQLHEMLANAQTKFLLQNELAAIVDEGKPMVESTYILEGDGTLAWQCYEQLLIIQNSIHSANLPTLMALSREVSGGNVALAQQYHQYGIAAIRPGWEYFTNTVMGVMGPQVEMFKAARLFSPRHLTQLRPVDVLKSIAFLNGAAMIVNMKNELPRYLARANGIADGVDPIRWWKEKSSSHSGLHQLSLAYCAAFICIVRESIFYFYDRIWSLAGPRPARLHRMLAYASVQ